MKKLLRLFTGLLVSSFILGAMAPSARAIVIGAATDNGNGTYTYSYSIDNTVGAFDVVAFSLEFSFLSSQIDWNQFDVAGGGGVTVANADWIAQAGIPITGLSAQDFFSIASSGDVLTGSSLSGFSFISALAPGVITYYYEFGALGDTASGTTLGPVAADTAPGVPDSGSSLALLVISLGFLAGGRRWFWPDLRLATA